MSKKTILSIILSIFLSILILNISFIYYTRMSENFLKQNLVTLEIKIDKNEKFIDTYNKLFKYLDTPPFFKYYVKHILHLDRDRKYGFYKAENISLKKLLENISKGRQQVYKIVIAGGTNIYGIGSILSKKKIVSYEKFIRTCFNKKFILRLTGKKLYSIEGFLYPDTYRFFRDSKPKQLIETMYNNFLLHMPDDWQRKISRLGLSDYEGIILASIIQKETYKNEEYSIVASVFYNRLQKSMRLQSDPTVIYGMYNNFDGNLKKKT